MTTAWCSSLAYTDFLAMLISDEVARHWSKKFDMRLRRAQFRTTKTLEQFDFERLPQLNLALVHDLATGRYLQEKAPVLIVGPCGTGKSHLAQALGHCALRQAVDVVFATCASLTQSLNAARATGSYERKLATLARVPLLIIDDFGLKPLRAPADEDLHDLIAERYEQGSASAAGFAPTSGKCRLPDGYGYPPSKEGYVTQRVFTSSRAQSCAGSSRQLWRDGLDADDAGKKKPPVDLPVGLSARHPVDFQKSPVTMLASLSLA